MENLDTPIVLASAFATGVAAHLVLFRKGEWDLFTVKFLILSTGLQAAGVYALLSLQPSRDVFSAVRTISALGIAVWTGIFTSMIIYRAFFHRLCRFPGPFLARISNFYPTYLSAKNLHLYEEVQKLHEQYGDIVRLGPSELSINNAAAMAAIHGPSSKCVKGPWYNILHPMVSLQLIRDKPEHIRRRRVWDRGFSAKALRDYEPRVINYTEQLLDQVERRKGQPVNATDWFNFYSFDVMGDLAWGKSFNMLRDGIKHYFMKSLHADMTNVGLFSHLLWLFPLFKATPILNAENKKFWNWVSSQVSERKQMKPDQPDVFSWLLDDHNSRKPTAQDELNLMGDAYLIAVAGSDTTAATLTCLFFQLAQNPKALSDLQAEIDSVFDATENVDANALSKLPVLNAAINESLRLHPAVPSGLQRMTPPQGITVGDTFIPGDSIVQIPSHTIHRDARYFPKPNEFIPERWTTKPELVKDASIFQPFSTGRYSCIGKQLGLMEVRNVTAQLVRRYNVTLAPGQSPAAFLQGKRDTFTLALGDLNLSLSDRQKI